MKWISTIVFLAGWIQAADPDTSLSNLLSQGYLGASRVAGKVETGPLYLLQTIRVETRGVLSDMPDLSDFSGKPLTRENAGAMRKRLEKHLMGNGFVFAYLEPHLEGSMETDGVGKVHLAWRVNAGDGFKLGKLLPLETKTLEPVFFRLSLLKRGETYNPARIEQARRKMNRSGYYEEVIIHRVYRDSTRNLLYPSFVVRDRRNNSIGGLLGFSSEESNRLEGLLDVVLRNLLGTARDFDLNFSGQERERHLTMRYQEPWLWTLPLGAGGELEILLQDSLYNENLTGLYLFQEMDFNSRYQLSFQRQNNETFIPLGPDSATIELSTAWITGMETLFDFRDRHPHTTSGSKFQVGVKGLRRGSSDSTAYLAQNTLGAEAWIPLGKRFLFYSRLFQKGNWPLRTSLLNRGNLFLSGGANSIRGYRENTFLTNSLVFANVEGQFLINRENRFFLFADPALVNRLEENFHWRRVMGYGAGIDLGKKDWRFGVSYALNPDRKISDGLLHFKLVNRF